MINFLIEYYNESIEVIFQRFGMSLKSNPFNDTQNIVVGQAFSLGLVYVIDEKRKAYYLF